MIDVIGLGDVRCERRGSNTVQDETRDSPAGGGTNKILEGTWRRRLVVCVPYLSDFIIRARQQI